MTGKAADDDGHVVPDLESTSELPMVPPQSVGEPALLEDFFSTQDVSRDRMRRAVRGRRRGGAPGPGAESETGATPSSGAESGSGAEPNAEPCPTEGAGSAEGGWAHPAPGRSAQVPATVPMTAFDVSGVATVPAPPSDPVSQDGQRPTPGTRPGARAGGTGPVHAGKAAVTSPDSDSTGATPEPGDCASTVSEMTDSGPADPGGAQAGPPAPGPAGPERAADPSPEEAPESPAGRDGLGERSPEDTTAPRRRPEPRTDVMVADPGWATGRAPAPTREEAVPDALSQPRARPPGGSPLPQPGGPPPENTATVQVPLAGFAVAAPGSPGWPPPGNPGSAGPVPHGEPAPPWQAGGPYPAPGPSHGPRWRTVAGLIAAAGAAVVAGVFVLLSWPGYGYEHNAQSPRSCPGGGCSAAKKAAAGGAGGLGARVVYRTVEQATGYFEGTVTFVNTSDQAMPTWALSFSYPGADIRNVWEAVLRQPGQSVVIASATTARPIPPGGTFEVRFGGAGTPSMPQDCRLNSQPCTFTR